MRHTRWITPQGHRIELTHGTATSHTDGRHRVSGAAWDGWRLTVKHPRSLVVLTEEYLGAEVDELALKRALKAIDAEPVEGAWPPKPPPPAWVEQAEEAGRRAAERWNT